MNIRRFVVDLTLCAVLLVPSTGTPQGFEDWQKQEQDAWRIFKQNEQEKPAVPKQMTDRLPVTDEPPDTMLRPVPEQALSGAGPVTNDEVDPVVLPAGAVSSINPEAGWAMDLAREPGKLLDALEGGRPDGHVSAMMALIRQTQGPFDEAEEQAMLKQYAPYAVSGSAKARKAIRRQNELLLMAMVRRQAMMQAAREREFAAAAAEIARLMQDRDNALIADQLADIQQQVMKEQQEGLEELLRLSEAEPIPTPDELVAEDKAGRENALAALELPAAAETNRTLLGHAYLERVHCEQPQVDMGDTRMEVKVTETGAAASYYVVEGNILVWKYLCTWDIPKVIPLHGVWDGQKVVDVGVSEVPLKIQFENAGDLPPEGHWDPMMVVGIGDTDWSPEAKRSLKDVQDRAGLRIDFDPKIPAGDMKPAMLGTYKFPTPGDKGSHIMFCIRCGRRGTWAVCWDYRWEPVDRSSPLPVEKPKPEEERNEAIAEHEANIAAAQRALAGIEKEMATEQDRDRREELRLQAVHMKQNIHDSKDLIESIRTGTLVKTRGPWDEHAAVVLAETSRRLRDDCLRAQQVQAAYVRMLNQLRKMDPDAARAFDDKLVTDVIRGILEPGGFEKARKAMDALHARTKKTAEAAQEVRCADKDERAIRLQAAELDLWLVEGLKKNCDRAIFVGTFFTGVGAGMVLNVAYESANVGIEKGATAGIKTMVVQGGTMLAFVGVLKAGNWGIKQFLNPKVAQSEVNTFKNLLDANRYQQELEMNRSLVDQLKTRVRAFEQCKATGSRDYLKVRAQLDDAVSAVNGSSLAKRLMKNELTLLEAEIKSGATRDYSRLRDCLGYQKVFENRLQRNIYPRADMKMVQELRRQGYNVENRWFQEYRNACSRGVNADRDIGLLAKYERQLRKGGQPATLCEFMDDAQKAYNSGYRQVTGRSAGLADQSLTTSAHSESFPVSWLQNRVSGPFTTMNPPVTPADFEKAGSAMFQKVQNALKGSDPAFVNLKKACGSLAKDLKTKVFDRLKNPPSRTLVPPASREAALRHWKDVQKVLDDFASDKCDPLTTLRKLQQLTGSTSLTQSAAEIRRLMIRLGNAQ